MAKPKASTSSKPEPSGDLDGLIRAHAAFIKRSERHVLEVVSDTDDMLDALKAKAVKLAAPGGAPVARAKVKATIGQLQEIQGAHILKATSKIRKGAVAAAIETHESTLEIGDRDFGVSFEGLSAAQVKAIANQKVLGASLDKYASTVSASRKLKLGREMQAGVAMGEGFDQIVGRLEAITGGTKNELMVLARTTIQTAANNAARETYAQNEDILDGVVWVATLDDRTCPTCGPLDGREYHYKPEAGQQSVESMPEAPIHGNCRCYVAPLVTGMPRPEVPTWDKWITRQPADVQDDILGEDRAKLLRSGDIEPSQFVQKNGALRSVESLRRAAA